jgi:hypothetical protein
MAKVDLELVDKLYGFLTEGIRSKDGKLILKDGKPQIPTLEQLEKHKDVGRTIEAIRAAIDDDTEYSFPLVMSACLQGERDAKIMVPLIVPEEGTRRRYRLQLIESIGILADAVGIPMDQRAYDRAWAFKLCDRAEEKAGSDGVVALKGKTLVEMQTAYRQDSGLRRHLIEVRQWATPRDRSRTQTEEATKPEAPPKKDATPVEDPLSGLL